MNIIILPLLMLNNLNLNNKTWEYGPEIIYNVTYQATTNPHYRVSNKTDQIVIYNHGTELKCRQRGAKLLNCQLTEPNVYLSLHNLTSNQSIVSNTDIGEKELANFNFEIRFNRFGIKEFVVPSTISPFILDMVRSIVNQFHTGIDLNDKTSGIYRTWENFTTGDCFTSYNIQLFNTTYNESANQNNKIINKWSPYMTTIINKTRNIDKCRDIAPYFFGSRESWRDNPKGITLVKSSTSLIIANQSYFFSTTESHVVLDNTRARPPGIIKMHEKMTVIFDKIIPANDKINKIQDPASAGIVTGKWLHDDFSQENNLDEEKIII